MNEIGKTILKAIYQNNWIRIEYVNKKSEHTSFVVGINDINTYYKSFSIDSFNNLYSLETSERTIYFDGIQSALLLDKTYHETPSELIDKINRNKEEYSFLNFSIDNNDIIDYYTDCFKLDTVPYVSKYSLIPGIDDDTLCIDYKYSLNEEQFKKISEELIFEKENKENRKTERIQNDLVVSILSIKNKKGLYILAYRNLLLDFKDKTLKASKSISINKEFSYNPDSNKVENVDSIHKYLPEEDYNLLDDFSKNFEEIKKSIREYNDTRLSSYKRELKVDTRPFISTISKTYIVDIDSQMQGIKNMINGKTEMSEPLNTFFGTYEKPKKRINYPIFTVDNRYNVDQINAINIGLKSISSYIQGPPGTGKTQTLLNAIITAEFNNKTVLVTSNNNIPMDGIYNSIKKLKYKNYDLLFPAIRLGSFEYVDSAIDRINEMYEYALTLTPKDSSINRIKEKTQEKQKPLVNFLNRYEKYNDLNERKNGLTKMMDLNNDDMFKLNISSELSKVEEELKKNGEVDFLEFDTYMSQNYNEVSQAIHYETAKNLQNISKPRYRDLYTIIKMSVEDEEDRKERVKLFRDYLSNNENLRLFQEIFKVIITTNLSSTYLGDVNKQFDIVMMDEAGQCNIVNALIPISRGKQLMLVGDPQQLKPVILLDNSINNNLKSKYHIPEEYDYINNSIYTTFTKVDIINNETLLSYHYRCDKRIINFSNKKYYHSKLKLKRISEEENPLVYYDTSEQDQLSENYEKNMSLIEAKKICEIIKENPNKEIGVITPFVRQKECIEYCLKQEKITGVPVGTVHSYQGEEKDIIIFSTAITKNTFIKTYDWLKDNRELINVAISRAKNKFVMIGSKQSINALSNSNDDLKELSNYVSSNGVSKVTDVSIPSSALGTRQINTESEKEFSLTINHALSILTSHCYIKDEVPIASIFNKLGSESSLFYMERFDIVIFERRANGDIPIMAIELNGPEHYSKEEVIERDKKKKEFCEKHNLPLYSIPRDCARDYQLIKSTLKEYV